MSKNISELRQDLISGDWVTIATGRAKRPHEFLTQKRRKFGQPRSECPFENIFPNRLLALASKEGGNIKKDWFVQVVPNKFPAFGRGVCRLIKKSGPYSWRDGVGFHEVVVTRYHDKSLALFSDEEAELVIRAYHQRYISLKDESCVEYISIFHNHGREAGATLSHPHSQIIALPVVPPDVRRSIAGATKYFYENKKCVHCEMLSFEKKAGVRVVYENNSFLAFCPFASRTAFEIRIFPKKHSPSFEEITVAERKELANILRISLAKLYHGLRDPSYNFFLHTTPTSDGKRISHYHWHFEIVPKTAIWAGFEIGTGIEISTIAPENAAKFFRKIKI